MPNATNPKALREQKVTLWNEMKAFNDAINAAGTRKYTAEEDAKWQAMSADLSALSNRIDREEQLERIAVELATAQNDLGAGHRIVGNDGANADGSSTRMSDQEAQAFAMQNWLWSGNPDFRDSVTDKHKNAAKQFDAGLGKTAPDKLTFNLHGSFNTVRRSFSNSLSSLTGSTGGLLIPETFSGEFERARLQFGGLLNVASVMRTKGGEPFKWPMANDTSNKGVQIGEAVANGTTTDPAFSAAIWQSYDFSSGIVLVPYSLLRDSAINLAAELGSMLGERLGRLYADKYAFGTGANTIQGVTIGGTLGNTAASASAIAWDEIIALEHTVDPQYRSNCTYVLHDSTVAVLRKLKNGQGSYLWQTSANSGTPDTLNNRPFVVDQSIPVIAASAKVIVFGDLSYYKIREVASIRLYRLSELYRANDQDGFVAMQSMDAKILDAGTHPIKYLQMHS